jgi:hypothetical protein
MSSAKTGAVPVGLRMNGLCGTWSGTKDLRTADSLLRLAMAA